MRSRERVGDPRISSTIGTLDDVARHILRANDRGGHTVPTSGLYPFERNWNSALVAPGWATFDPALA